MSVQLEWTESLTDASMIEMYQVWRSAALDPDDDNFLQTFSKIADVEVERDDYGAITNEPYSYEDVDAEPTAEDPLHYYVLAVPVQGPSARSNVITFDTTPILTEPNLEDETVHAINLEGALTLLFGFYADGQFTLELPDGGDLYIATAGETAPYDFINQWWPDETSFDPTLFEVRLTVNSGFLSSGLGAPQDVWHSLNDNPEFILSAGTDPPAESEWLFEIRYADDLSIAASATFSIFTAQTP